MIFPSYMKHSIETYQLFFGSLANPNRLQIINLLRSGKKNVTQISKALDFEQTMVSHNMKRLERCGMVFVEQIGKERFYSVNTKSIKPLLEMIDTHMGEYCHHIICKSK